MTTHFSSIKAYNILPNDRVNVSVEYDGYSKVKGFLVLSVGEDYVKVCIRGKVEKIHENDIRSFENRFLELTGKEAWKWRKK